MPDNYSYRLTIATPIALLDVANSIARSMDPDVGGADSFSSVKAVSPTKQEYVVCDVWIRQSFSIQATAILADPKILYQLCLADYTSRWADLAPPTLKDCESFISSSVINITVRDERSLDSILAAHNLTLVPPSTLEI